MWRTWERREQYTQLWWENTTIRDHLEDLGVDGRIILKIFKQIELGVDLIGLVQEGEKRLAVVMNLGLL
jgi:hypothetical protein